MIFAASLEVNSPICRGQRQPCTCPVMRLSRRVRLRFRALDLIIQQEYCPALLLVNKAVKHSVRVVNKAKKLQITRLWYLWRGVTSITFNVPIKYSLLLAELSKAKFREWFSNLFYFLDFGFSLSLQLALSRRNGVRPISYHKLSTSKWDEFTKSNE